jgi:hypothetical protein
MGDRRSWRKPGRDVRHVRKTYDESPGYVPQYYAPYPSFGRSSFGHIAAPMMVIPEMTFGAPPPGMEYATVLIQKKKSSHHRAPAPAYDYHDYDKPHDFTLKVMTRIIKNPDGESDDLVGVRCCPRFTQGRCDEKGRDHRLHEYPLCVYNILGLCTRGDDRCPFQHKCGSVEMTLDTIPEPILTKIRPALARVWNSQCEDELPEQLRIMEKMEPPKDSHARHYRDRVRSKWAPKGAAAASKPDDVPVGIRGRL